MTSITRAGPRCVQELAAILAPQNRTQGRCVVFSFHNLNSSWSKAVLIFNNVLYGSNDFSTSFSRHGTPFLHIYEYPYHDDEMQTTLKSL